MAHDPREPGAPKKKLDDAINAMARKSQPEDERFHKLGLAKLINQSHGGPVVTVWDVDDLPQDWVDFFIGITNDMPRIIKRQQMIDKAFKEFEDSHPQYGKRQ